MGRRQGRLNLTKHGVSFDEAVTTFYARWPCSRKTNRISGASDGSSLVGQSSRGRNSRDHLRRAQREIQLVAQLVTPREGKEDMKKYDFRKAKRADFEGSPYSSWTGSAATATPSCSTRTSSTSSTEAAAPGTDPYNPNRPALREAVSGTRTDLRDELVKDEGFISRIWSRSPPTPAPRGARRRHYRRGSAGLSHRSDRPPEGGR